jgi:hypothetical protein
MPISKISNPSSTGSLRLYRAMEVDGIADRRKTARADLLID